MKHFAYFHERGPHFRLLRPDGTDTEGVMRKRLFVLAGNWRQYADWCRERGYHPCESKVVHVTCPSSIWGVHFPADGKLIRAGTWADLPWLADFENYLQCVESYPEGQLLMDFDYTGEPD